MDKFDAIIDDLKNNKQPQICNCYHTTTERHYFNDYELGYRAALGLSGKYEDREIATCYGTKECEVCKCKGDRCKCDFYEDVRKKALIEYAKAQKVRSQKALTNRERKELEFYRMWLVEHDLQYAAMSDFEKWEKNSVKNHYGTI